MNFEPSLTANDTQANETNILSERELEVLQKAADGASNKIIAAELGITDYTVDSHNRHIIAKLGAKNGKNAIAIGMRKGIIV